MSTYSGEIKKCDFCDNAQIAESTSTGIKECEICGKNICKEHSRFVETGSESKNPFKGNRWYFCPDCFDDLVNDCISKRDSILGKKEGEQ